MGTKADQGLHWWISLPSSPDRLASLRRRLRQFLQGLGLSPSIIHDIVLATHEAAVNGMIHGNAQDKRRRVYVEVEARPRTVIVEVRDEGAGFDWQAWLRHLDTKPTPPDAPSGRGILVMRALTDSLTFNRCGNRVRLTRRVTYSRDRRASASSRAKQPCASRRSAEGQ